MYQDGQVVNGHRYDAASNTWVALPPPMMVDPEIIGVAGHAKPRKSTTGRNIILGIIGVIVVAATLGAATGGTDTPPQPSAPAVAPSTPPPAVEEPSLEETVAAIQAQLTVAANAQDTAVATIQDGTFDTALLREQATIIDGAAARIEALAGDLPACAEEATRLAADGVATAADGVRLAADGIDEFSPTTISRATDLMGESNATISAATAMIGSC